MRTIDRGTQFASKQAPFGSIRKVPPLEGQRWPIYQRRAINSSLRRDWTHEEVDRLVTMLDAGYDYDHCARKLHRTRTAIVVKTKRTGCKMLRRPTVLTAREVAVLIGKKCAKSVTWWIDAGWLRARAAVMGGRKIWRVQYDDLIAFLQNDRYWMAWDAERMTDRDLRTEMRSLRASAPRWLTIGEVARRYSVLSNTVGQWITKGFLPAMRYGNWFIREDVIEGWLPPCERSKAGIPKSMGRAVVGTSAIVARPL